MSEDIVVQLRGWSEGSSDDSRRMVWLMRQSADTIEALRGEVDLIKTLGVGAALETVAQKERAQKAEAEAEALRGEVERLRSTFNAGTVEQILKVTQDRAEQAEAENARLTEERDSAQRVGIQTMRERDEARADEELMSKAKQACEAENARLKVALEAIQNMKLSRPVAHYSSPDHKRSIYDLCVHKVMMRDTCEECIQDFARKALAGETT